MSNFGTWKSCLHSKSKSEAMIYIVWIDNQIISYHKTCEGAKKVIDHSFSGHVWTHDHVKCLHLAMINDKCVAYISMETLNDS